MKKRPFLLVFCVLFGVNALFAQTTWTAPTMDQFIGINVLIDRADYSKAAKFKTVRVFHDWPSDIGVPNSAVPHTPLNYFPGTPTVSKKLSWNYSYNRNRAINFMEVYGKFNASPVFNRPSPEFFGQTVISTFNKSGDYRPVANNTTQTNPLPYYQLQTSSTPNPRLVAQLPIKYYDNPTDYLQYTKWVSLFAAQFGYKDYLQGHGLQNQFFDFHVNNFKMGTSTTHPRLKYMEVWNEADKFWPDQNILFTPDPDGNGPLMGSGFIDPKETDIIEQMQPTYACFRPQEYGALLSAAYDGHYGKMQVEGVEKNIPIKYNLGIKNMGQDIQVVFTGLVDLRHKYVGQTLEALYNPNGINPRPMEAPVPFDVLNFHHYSSSAAPIDKEGFRDGYNFAGAGSTTIGVHPEAETEKLKERIEALIGDLENTSTDGIKTFDLNTKEIWLSEFGYDSYKETDPLDGKTGLELPPNLNLGDVYYTQGQWLTRSYLALAAARTDLKRGLDKVYAYKMNDDPNQGNDQFGNCGLLDAKNRPKQSWYFIRTLQNVLKGYSFDDPSANLDYIPNFQQPMLTNLKTYVFKNGTNRMLAIWSASSQDIKSTGTLVVKELPNFINSYTTATKVSVQIPDENGRYEALSGVGNRQIPNLTITETPIFIQLGVSKTDPEIQPVNAAVVSDCYCSGVRLYWKIPKDAKYRYYRVYYKQFCGANPNLTPDLLKLDLNSWTLYAEQLQGNQTEITVSGLSDCSNAQGGDTWYAFHIVPIGRNPLDPNDEILPNITYGANQAVTYRFEDCANTESCILAETEYSVTAPPGYINNVKSIVSPIQDECKLLNMPGSNAHNPLLYWIGDEFILNFNVPQRLNSIHILTTGLGRLEISYFDACKQCWVSFPSVEYYQINNDQWYVMNGMQLPRNPIEKIKVKRTGLLGTNGVPDDGLGFGVHRFIICSHDQDCIKYNAFAQKGEINNFRAENVSYDAATLAWETALLDPETPERGIFDWYEVRYSKSISEDGTLLNPIGEVQGISTEINDAEVIFRLNGLEPATDYHVEVSALDNPNNQCSATNLNTSALLSIRTEGKTKIGERTIENAQIQKSNSILLSPNPTSDWLNVRGNEYNFAQVEVVDMVGKVHLRKLATQGNNLSLNVGTLPEGLYYLRLIGNGEMVVKPFVKILK
jgi:hypothetical protein